MSESKPTQPVTSDQANKPKPKRVISPRMRVMLIIVLALFSLLTANGIYLAIVTWTQHFTGEVWEDLFYQYMFLAHLVLGVILVAPVVIFGIVHWLAARNRRNRRAIRIGYALFAIAIVVLLSGILLTRQFGFDLKQPLVRSAIYWAHIIAPLAAIWLYWLHRLVGPRIKWYVGARIGLATAAVVGAMIYFQFQDPRQWNVAGPKEGERYFQPSLARTSTGNFIPAQSLMNDDYCVRCHKDIYNNWFHSAHHFSSFNNPAYLSSVRETRKAVLERDGTVQASRWCAGCHDPVPFFSGAFDDPKYDDVHDVTSQAGITCTVCHAITHVNSTKGNADYVIEEPIQYPFTFSKNPILKSVNELLVKAKPGFHKKTFLKPLHKSAEFCSTCHKVHLPKELTAYKDFLRGQNHYDSYLLSGVSGHGASSFYYPPIAQTNCNGCHMPQVASDDFGARYSDELKKLAVHDHFFPGANTALPYWRGEEDWTEYAKKLLVGTTRIDIFGVRREGTIEGELIAPLGPDFPVLEPGNRYLIETVVRTLKLGHHLTQGTVDSNELWVELEAKSGERVLGISGGMEPDGTVDPWSHFVNVFMLDRNGDRIARRNAQDIFTPLYNHQIPPGAGQTIHYALQVPKDISAPIQVTAKLKYRKFDKVYIDFMNRAYREGDNEFKNRGQAGTATNELPVTIMAQDTVVFDVQLANGEVAKVDRAALPKREPPVEWQRWNDYGIGMFLMGTSQLRQAADAFRKVESLKRYDGPLNLARVLFVEGDLNAAVEALNRAAAMDDPKPPAWTLAWLSGEVSRQQGFFEDAANSFRSVLYDETQERRERKFDFSFDPRIHNSLGLTLVDLAEQAESRSQSDTAKELLNEAEIEFLKTLKIDSEDISAHANLAAIYQRLGNTEKAAIHEALHVEYKADDNAAEVARPEARRQYPAADHAAESLVIYWLHRAGAPQLPDAEAAEDPTIRHGKTDDPIPLSDSESLSLPISKSARVDILENTSGEGNE